MVDVLVDGLAKVVELGGDLVGVFGLGIDRRGWWVAVRTIECGGGTADVNGGYLTRTASACQAGGVVEDIADGGDAVGGLVALDGSDGELAGAMAGGVDGGEGGYSGGRRRQHSSVPCHNE